MSKYTSKDILMQTVRDLEEDGYSYQNMIKMSDCFQAACQICFPAGVEKIIKTTMVDIKDIVKNLKRFIAQDNYHMIKSLGLVFHVYPSDFASNAIFSELHKDKRGDLIVLMLEGIDEHILDEIRFDLNRCWGDPALDQILLSIQEKSAINDVLEDSSQERKKKKM